MISKGKIWASTWDYGLVLLTLLPELRIGLGYDLCCRECETHRPSVKKLYTEGSLNNNYHRGPVETADLKFI